MIASPHRAEQRQDGQKIRNQRGTTEPCRLPAFPVKPKAVPAAARSRAACQCCDKSVSSPLGLAICSLLASKRFFLRRSCNPMINSCAVSGSCCAALKPFPSAPLTRVGWKGPGNLHGGVGCWFAPSGPRLCDAARGCGELCHRRRAKATTHRLCLMGMTRGRGPGGLPKSRRVLWVPG